ncbi:MAG: class I SAM-dependent methyltransferase [Gemmatimonadota bacterium]
MIDGSHPRALSPERSSAATHGSEVAAGRRFEFGANWSRFLQHLTDQRIGEAERSLRELLGSATLTGKTFLDIGSGSGLFSLAARRLGAHVTSVDFDPQSVGCTESLRARYFADDRDWRVAEGSVLDEAMLASLGEFDVVYSWGVLHHTGAMWQAIENAARRVAPGGLFCIAIYNYQVYWSAYYTALKRGYVAAPRGLKWTISGPYIVGQVLKGLAKDLLFLRNPMTRYRVKVHSRGMSMWYDWIDWIGGYPFEVARPEEVFEFVRTRGFSLERLTTCGGGHGCNEFLFRRG